MSRAPYNLYRDLGARPATFASRALAAAVDWALLLLIGSAAFLTFGLGLLQGEQPPPDASGLDAAPSPIARGVDVTHLAVLLLPVFLTWLWNRVVRVSRSGESVGMGWLGIRLVSVRTGTSPTADQAVLRAMTGLLLTLPGGLGLLSMFFDKERRGLHDRASGVVIIRPPE